MKQSSRPWWDPLSFVCLLTMMWLASYRLQKTEWTPLLYEVITLVTLATIAGAALGASTFKRWTVRLMAVVFTLFAVPWRLALVVPDYETWPDRLTQLSGRLMVDLMQFVQSQPVEDTTLFLGCMMALFWILGLLAGYGLLRSGDPWVPVIFSGITLALVEYYHPFLPLNAAYSGLFVLLGLALLSRITFLRSQQTWQQQKVMVDPEAGFDITRGVMVGGLVLVLVAWNMPGLFEILTPGSAAQEKASATWEGFRQRMSNLFVSLQGGAGAPLENWSADWTLGTGSALSEDVVFTASIAGYHPSGGRYYWRARAFDEYLQGRWTTGVGDRRILRSERDTLDVPAWLARQTQTVTFTSSAVTSNVLFTPAVPIRLSRQAEALYSKNSDGTEDVVALLPVQPVAFGDIYSVEALTATPTQVQLRAAGTEYPLWIRQRYLQLPSHLSADVYNLAMRVAAGAETPYDKAQAITTYLRSSIEYRETIPGPPAGKDPVEWFLFDYKAGFCNYYASAEVLLLRSLGVPARLVVGYAQGVYDSTTDLYTVRRKESHAWPEVYFPGLGWIEFEPTSPLPLPVYPVGQQTSGQDPLDAALQRGLRENLGIGERRAEELMEQGALGSNPPVVVSPLRYLPLFISLLVFGLSGLAIFLWYRRAPQQRALPVLLVHAIEVRGETAPTWLNAWARKARLTPLEKMYDSVNTWANWLGVRPDSSRTPAELGRVLEQVVPEGQEAAAAMLEEYQRATYSPYPLNAERLNRAYATLRQKMLRAVWKRLWAKIFREA